MDRAHRRGCGDRASDDRYSNADAVTRRPVNAAHSLASLDLLSGGRLVVGVGAGFPGRFGVPLHRLSEVPWERRFTRLDETVALWRQLWTADNPVTFHGEVMRLDGARPMIRPHTPCGPPIWLGGATPAALKRTGRMYDGWLPYPPARGGLRRQLEGRTGPGTDSHTRPLRLGRDHQHHRRGRATAPFVRARELRHGPRRPPADPGCRRRAAGVRHGLSPGVRRGRHQLELLAA